MRIPRDEQTISRFSPRKSHRYSHNLVIDIHMVFDYKRTLKKIIDPFKTILEKKKPFQDSSLVLLDKRKIVTIVIVGPL